MIRRRSEQGCARLKRARTLVAVNVPRAQTASNRFPTTGTFCQRITRPTGWSRLTLECGPWLRRCVKTSHQWTRPPWSRGVSATGVAIVGGLHVARHCYGSPGGGNGCRGEPVLESSAQRDKLGVLQPPHACVMLVTRPSSPLRPASTDISLASTKPCTGLKG